MRLNPFARRESRTRSELATYRALTLTSWALAVGVSIYFCVRAPRHWGGHDAHRIGRQNRAHPTGFSLNMPLVYAYWAVLFALQGSYVGHLHHTAREHQSARCAAAVGVGSHFVTNNLLHVAFVLLFVTGHFVWAELVLLANWANLLALYARHPAASHPLSLVHAPVVAGPLAWTFVALFWNGAMMMPHAHALPMRILANVFVWAILGYGLFYVMTFADYSMGFALSVLAAALGVGQFLHHVIALQWIFAFTIMAVLFLATMAIAVPAWTGRRNLVVILYGDERAPLLAGH